MAVGDTNLTNLVLSGDLTVGDDVTVTGDLAVSGTVTARNAPYQFVAGGSALTLTAATHAGKVIRLDTATGSTITLPAATGTGNVYGFVTYVLATSNSHIVKVANSTDVMSGALVVVDDSNGSATTFGTVAASDTITLNRTTTGSVKIGEMFFITDVKAGYFNVFGVVIATGTEATPFSATV